MKSRKIIQQLFADGKSFAIFPIRVIYLEMNNEMSCLQAGFTASTRHFKKAVDRNRIKRLLRESYRLHKHSLKNNLEESHKQVAVFFIFTGKELPEYPLIVEKMKTALRRLEEFFLQ